MWRHTSFSLPFTSILLTQKKGPQLHVLPMKNAEPVVLLSSSHVRPELLLDLIDQIEDLSDLLIDRHVTLKKWWGAELSNLLVLLCTKPLQLVA